MGPILGINTSPITDDTICLHCGAARKDHDKLYFHGTLYYCDPKLANGNMFQLFFASNAYGDAMDLAFAAAKKKPLSQECICGCARVCCDYHRDGGGDP